MSEYCSRCGAYHTGDCLSSRELPSATVIQEKEIERLSEKVRELQRQVDHFRHLATDTVAAQPGQYEILGPISGEIRTYTSVPVEEFDVLKRKANALDILLRHCKLPRYTQGAARIVVYDLFNDLELGPYISKCEIESLEEIEALEVEDE